MGNCIQPEPRADATGATDTTGATGATDEVNNVADGVRGLSISMGVHGVNLTKIEIENLSNAQCGADFTLEGERYIANIVDYYDGDTVRVVFYFHGKQVQHRARLLGFDSPEMRPLKSNPHRIEEKKAAKVARQALISKIGGKLVYIECDKFDKYGRLLVTIYARNGTENGENINEWMITSGFGTRYDGGHKSDFKPRST